MSSNIVFTPWVGKHYGSDKSVLKRRTLVLGGSHYLKNANATGDLGDSTNEMVDFYLDPNCKDDWKKTYSTFINSIFGRSSTPKERMIFFDSVVFYNYLQEVAGDNPGAAGNCDYGAEPHFNAFKEVVDKHRPEVIISWGDKVWEGLPNNWGFGEAVRGAGIAIGNKVFMSYLEYPYRNQRILLVGANHPSIGYDSDYHHQIFKALGIV